jgi:hypothetical protein
MKKLIILLTVLIQQTAFSFECVNKDELANLKPNTEKVIIKNFVHTLVYEKDSCGARGCDIAIYSQVLSKCIVNSLNVKGFVLENSLEPNQVTISVDTKNTTFFYSPVRGQFGL